jgi:FkbM family methyltransferase
MIRILSDLLRPYSFRGKARLLHTLCPSQGEREQKIFGYRMRLDLSDFIQRSTYLGTFEPVESAQVKGYLKEGMTFVDVGANVGYYTLLAASLVGKSGRVFSFEPSPYAFGRLQETITQNDLSNIRIECSGLSDRAGELELFMPIRNGNHTPTMVPNDGGSPIKVPIRTLDEYLEAEKIHHVDLLKVDVEGFEPNVIGGASAHMKRRKIHAVLCEFNQEWLTANNSSVDALYELMLGFGYKSRDGRPAIESPVQNSLFTLS